MDASILLEIISAFFPQFFLFFASIANIGKNVAWLSISATRASIHRSFLKRENLADITAKAGSQTIAASIIGTALGIGISYFTGSNPTNILVAFLALSMVHLSCNYISLSHLILPHLNKTRYNTICNTFIHSNGSIVLKPNEVRKVDRIIGTYKNADGDRSVLVPHEWDKSSTLLLADSLLRISQSMTPTQFQQWTQRWSAYPFVVHVSLRASTSPSSDKSSASSDGMQANEILFHDLMKQKGRWTRFENQVITSIRQLFKSFFSLFQSSNNNNQQNLNNEEHVEVSLLFKEGATSEDMLIAHLLVSHFRYHYHQTCVSSSKSTSAISPSIDIDELLIKSCEFTMQHKQQFIQSLHQNGWDTKHIFLHLKDKENSRIRFLGSSTTRHD